MAKKSEQKDLAFIEDLKRRWMATVDAIRDPLMIINDDYVITKSNRSLADLTATPIKEVLGAKCFEKFAGRTSPCPGCQVAQVLLKDEVALFELDDMPGGRFYEVTAQPILSPTGEREGIVTIYRDRTEAKAMRDQLLQSKKLASIGLLAGGIAHELNNPLGGIIIFSQMLLREMATESPHYQDVVEIENAAQRCKEIVSGLLDFARMQPSHPDRREVVDLKHAVQSALKFSLVGTRRSEVEVIEELEGTPFAVAGSLNKMIQLFLNLIQNALQAMPEGGALTLRSSHAIQRGKPYITIEVIDTGTGIAKEIADKIFDPFFTSKDVGEGTGLGLSICHSIASEFDGTITFESDNSGTTFVVTFPLLGPGTALKSA